MVKIWKLQDAKAQFSRMVREALDDGPQIVTRHGKEVAVLVSYEVYARLTAERPSLVAHLLAAPQVAKFEAPRDLDEVRDVEL